MLEFSPMNLRKEKSLWRKGFKCVVGVDEAGRGALAGPVVAAAVVILAARFKVFTPPSFQRKFERARNAKFKVLLKEVKDSKKLSPKKREELYQLLVKHPQVEWGIGRVGPRVIDRINILEATRLAMKRAVENLGKKLEQEIDFIILDGNFGLRAKRFDHVVQKSIVGADDKIFSCAAASIICKVYRDRMMRNYARKYPQYGFAQHKAYGTVLHRENLKRCGACKIHRKSFRLLLPISST